MEHTPVSEQTKSTVLIIILFLGISISIYFMYVRAFVSHHFEIINSDVGPNTISTNNQSGVSSTP